MSKIINSIMLMLISSSIDDVTLALGIYNELSRVDQIRLRYCFCNDGWMLKTYWWTEVRKALYPDNTIMDGFKRDHENYINLKLYEQNHPH